MSIQWKNSCLQKHLIAWGNACFFMVLNEKKRWNLQLFLAYGSFTVGSVCGSSCVSRNRKMSRPGWWRNQKVLLPRSFVLYWSLSLSLKHPRFCSCPAAKGIERTRQLRTLLGPAWPEFSLFWHSEGSRLFRLQLPGKSKVTPGIPKSFPQHSSTYFIFPTCPRRNGLSQCVYVLAKRGIFLVIQLESYRHSVLIPNSH